MKSPAERQTTYRAKHRDKVLAKKRAAYAANKAQRRAEAKAFRIAHPERAKLRYAKNRARLVAKKRTYNAERRDEINAKSRTYRTENIVKVLHRAEKYRDANRLTLREKNKVYAKANPASCAARAMKRLAVERSAMPCWVDTSAIKAIYKEAARLTQETGIKHNVDHFYPLQGRTVCGLHVPANLRVITASENFRKSNKHPDSLAS